MNTNTKHWASITAGILSLAGYASASSIGSEKYTYDSSGNIIKKSIDGQIIKMAYDQENRLIGRQIADQNPENIAYDASGRPIAEKSENHQTLRMMYYGYGDKVTAVEEPQEGTSSELFYNAEGLLVAAKDRKGSISTYTWDGISLASMNDGAFVSEDGIEGGTPSLCSKTGEIIVSDHLGTTLQKGTKCFSQTAYGEGLEAAWFTGKPYIPELEGYAFKHRTYSPTEGRWRTADPIGFPDGINSFAYLKDPNSGVDPLGTEVKLYVGRDKKSSHYVSADGDGDAYAVLGWSYTFSWSVYGGNSAHGTDGGLKFLIDGEGMKWGWINTVKLKVDLNMAVFEDSSGNLDYSNTGVDHFNTSPIVGGVRAQVTGVGTKKLRAEANGSVGHNGSTITEFGISTTGGSVAIGGTSDTISFQLGSWVWKES